MAYSGDRLFLKLVFSIKDLGEHYEDVQDEYSDDDYYEEYLDNYDSI